jgi:hypothetical protein
MTAFRGHLFTCSLGKNSLIISIWNSIFDAAAGKPADVVIEKSAKVSSWLPSNLWFDGNYLWVAEFKFGHLLYRFSPY